MAATKELFDKKKAAQVVELLRHFVADTAVLYFKTLNFHWNMEGPQFFMYHRLLEEQYKEMADAMDELSERIRMLGHKAPGSMAEYLKLTCVKESRDTLPWKEMVKELVKSHESMVSHLHELINFCDENYDQGTSDLLIERIRFHDKAAYLLRSHLKG